MANIWQGFCKSPHNKQAKSVSWFCCCIQQRQRFFFWCFLLVFFCSFHMNCPHELLFMVADRKERQCKTSQLLTFVILVLSSCCLSDQRVAGPSKILNNGRVNANRKMSSNKLNWCLKEHNFFSYLTQNMPTVSLFTHCACTDVMQSKIVSF